MYEDQVDLVKNVVAKVAGSYSCYSTRLPNPPQMPQPPKPQPKPTTVAHSCYHENIELYVRPCLRCERFCNCRHTHFPKYYPDVLVRSLDKYIVQLSGNLVRASETLSRMIDNFTRNRNGTSLQEETLLISHHEPSDSGTIKLYSTMGSRAAFVKTGALKPLNPIYESDESSDDSFFEKAIANIPIVLPPNYCIRNTAKQFRSGQPQYQRIFRKPDEEETCKLEDLIDFDKDKKLLTLFDHDSDRPTVGIKRDILMKIDYYVNMHLDDVDSRVEAKKRADTFRETSPYQAFNPEKRLDEAIEKRNINTFQYEDWEEDFFDVDTGTFLDYHKANQELLIWDLYFGIEKWFFLGRGFPQLMINGHYDLFEDPDFDPTDSTRSAHGLPGVYYPNPRRSSWHLKSRLNVSHFNHVNFTPRWWSVNRQQEEMRNSQSFGEEIIK